MFLTLKYHHICLSKMWQLIPLLRKFQKILEFQPALSRASTSPWLLKKKWLRKWNHECQNVWLSFAAVKKSREMFPQVRANFIKSFMFWIILSFAASSLKHDTPMKCFYTSKKIFNFDQSSLNPPFFTLPRLHTLLFFNYRTTAGHYNFKRTSSFWSDQGVSWKNGRTWGMV